MTPPPTASHRYRPGGGFAARLLALGLALALWAPAAAAERGPQRAAPTSAQAAAAAAGQQQVVVRWRAGAIGGRERERAQAAGAEQPLRRAQVLMHRHGIALADGASIDARTQVVRVAAAQQAALLARLALDPDVEWAEVDLRLHRASSVPDDLLFAANPLPSPPQHPAVGQWFLRAPTAEAPAAIDAVAAWARTRGNPDLVVAVLDTGVRFDHPDLAGKLLPGHDFVSDPATANDGDGRDADASDPGDYLLARDLGTPAFPFDDCGTQPQFSSWHGTQVAGLIAAATDNATGVAGAGWNLRVLPVRVLGKCGGRESDIAAAIRWAAGLEVPGEPSNPHPARVINLSLGAQAPCSPLFADAIAAARAAGAVVVAAAGNQGVAVNRPANCPGVVAVAGVRHVGTKVGYSSLGPEVALAAPAGNCVNLAGPCLYPLVTTSNTGSTVPAAPSYTGSGNDATIGTSFAAPLAAAAAGLMLSVQPGLSPDELAHRLRSSSRAFPAAADPGVPDCRVPTGFSAVEQLECRCTTNTCGAGLLDVGAAVARAAEPLPAAGGGGGGSVGFGWALGLALASLLLWRLDRRGRARAGPRRRFS